jgi:hypothetical protein
VYVAALGLYDEIRIETLSEVRQRQQTRSRSGS